MIDLIYKRADGSFVARIGGQPYHVVEGDEPLWQQAVAAVQDNPDLPFEPDIELPEPAPLRKLSKAALWRRLTDEEAEALDASLVAAPVRLQRIFEAAQYLDTSDADYPALRAGVEAALGATRAEAVLQPDH